MKVTICIGSSCHLKGSRQVVEQFQKLVSDNELQEKIELAGSFCMGDCQNGVCVKINENKYSVTPENAKVFFENEVMKRI